MRLVLNLIINGLPSIHKMSFVNVKLIGSFKPYYKWITFNTSAINDYEDDFICRFKPYYKWITFNTEILH